MSRCWQLVRSYAVLQTRSLPPRRTITYLHICSPFSCSVPGPVGKPNRRHRHQQRSNALACPYRPQPRASIQTHKSRCRTCQHLVPQLLATPAAPAYRTPMRKACRCGLLRGSVAWPLRRLARVSTRSTFSRALCRTTPDQAQAAGQAMVGWCCLLLACASECT